MYRKFIADFVKGVSSNLVIIMHNASIHKVSIINEFWRDAGV